MNEELSELLLAGYRRQWHKLFDAYGDLLYVVVGTGVALGLPTEEIFKVVHASNMTKDGKSNDQRISDKGPGFVPPDFGELVTWWKEHGQGRHIA